MVYVYEVQWNECKLVSSGCDGDALACDDVKCLPETYVCNRKEECADGTDEEQDCRTLPTPFRGVGGGRGVRGGKGARGGGRERLGRGVKGGTSEFKTPP